MNEQTAISLCLKQRDPRGFDYLVRRYQRQAYYHAAGFLGNSSDAEDACQEAFSRAYSQLPKLSSLPGFYPWFYVILKNHCLNRLRARRTAAESAADTTAATEPAAEHNQQTDPLSAIEGDATRDSVWQALSQLKAEFREILVLRHLHEASYADISELLGIPRGTVMSRLHHARQAFSRAWQTTSDAQTETQGARHG